MMRNSSRLLIPVTLIGFAACDSGGGRTDINPEQAEARAVAARQTCVAADLLANAREDVVGLEDAVAAAETTPNAEFTLPASRAALAFARTYERQAELRASALARVDSAFNHSPTVADSVRYAGAAADFATRPPEEGTVEANAFDSYLNDFAATFGDPDHRCNWDLEKEDS
jgi:hypothetical protein